MDAIQHLRKADERLAKVIDSIGSIDYAVYNNNPDSFLFLIREIVGQMISSSVKKVIWGRLLEICNNDITPNTICHLQIEQLRSIGLSQAKSN